MTISYSDSLRAMASGARGSSSFDWHTALPHGHSILSAEHLGNVLFAPGLRYVAGGVPRRDDVADLGFAGFSAFSSGVSSGYFSARAVAPGGDDTARLVSSAAEIARLGPRSAASKPA